MGNYILIVLLTIGGLAGCAKEDSNDQLRERAKIEEEGQNEKVRERARQMESDLADRHFYYNAIEGEFEGTLTVDKENYKIRFTFSRSLPPYSGSRIRELSEIENDLNNLYFHMQVVQWHPDDPASAVGCRVTGIRPNMDEGEFVIASSDCPNLYSVLLSEGGSKPFNDKKQKAIDLSERIKSKALSQIDNLIGYVQPSSVSSKYAFAVKRVN